MKKILSLLFIICLLVSCDSKKEGTKLPEIRTEYGTRLTVQHFVYKNHTYLYIDHSTNNKKSFVVHDPDCEYCFSSFD